MLFFIAVAVHERHEAPPVLAISTVSKEQAGNRLEWALVVATQDQPDGLTGWRRYEAEEYRIAE